MKKKSILILIINILFVFFLGCKGIKKVITVGAEISLKDSLNQISRTVSTIK